MRKSIKQMFERPTTETKELEIKKIHEEYVKNKKPIIILTENTVATFGTGTDILSFISTLVYSLKDNMKKEDFITAVNMAYLSHQEMADYLKKRLLDSLTKGEE